MADLGDEVTSTQDYFVRVKAAADYLIKEFGTPDLAIVLGSGLSQFDEILEDTKTITYDKVPFMPLPSVAGHSGRLTFGKLGKNKILCFAGRIHAYEDYHFFQLTFQARMAALAGAKIFFLTNAAGGWMEGLSVGDVMIMKDHFNMHWKCPVQDTAADPRFGNVAALNPSELYSPRIAELARTVAKENDMRIHSGVYTWNTGPAYETHAEVQALLKSGAQAFGMSTVPEVIAARSMGMEVFAISIITNLAAGMSDQPLHHDEVQEAAQGASAKLKSLLVGIMSRVDPVPTTLPADVAPETTPIRLMDHMHFTAQQQQECAQALKELNMNGPAVGTVVVTSSSLWKLPQAELASVRLPESVTFGSKSERAVATKYANFIALDLPLDDGVSDEAALLLAHALVDAGLTRVVQLVNGVPFDESVRAASAVISDAVAHTCGLGSFPKRSRASVSSLAQRAVAASAAKGHPLRSESYFHFPGPMFPTPAEAALAKNAAQVSTYGVTSISVNLAAAAAGAETLLLRVPSPLDDAANGALAAVLEDLASAASGGTFPAYQAASTRPAVGTVALRGIPVRPLTYADCEAAAAKCSSSLGKATLGFIIDRRIPLPDSFFKETSSVALSSVVDIPEGTSQRILFGTVQTTPPVEAYVIRDGTADAPWPLLNRKRGRDLPFGVRLLKQLGVQRLVVLTPATACKPGIAPGTIVAAKDHINMVGDSPLFGHNDPQFGSRFPDMSSPYLESLRKAALATAGVQVAEGCCMLLASCSCSDAEGNFAAFMGADVVTDAGIPEALAATHAQMPLSVLCPVVGAIGSDAAPVDYVPALYAVASSVVSA
mmetsp:Transcript_7665/g.17697  ORF Transcript_7665/g.17697 Transcript_7665/m.17697 type:complete len:831 (-) Transcript_7665:230-2722(-)